MKTAIDEQIGSKVPGLAIVAVDADGVLSLRVSAALTSPPVDG